ncbi:alpha/beta hydrolase [Kitasatospora sp. NPDC057198]|uniref:alpha/beta hydrolase n=1 Tax=Kitasatospora sp. NPDC057198 TaxID=3346046 RepID=UPI00363E09CF
MDVHTLQNARFDGLFAAADAYTRISENFSEHHDNWKSGVEGRTLSSGWAGDSADRARTSLKGTTVKLSSAAGELGSIAPLLREGAEAFMLAQGKLTNALADAKADGYQVGEDGSVSWEPSEPSLPGQGVTVEDMIRQDVRERQGIAYGMRIEQALKEAEHADQTIAERLRALTDDARTGKGLTFAAASIAMMRTLHEEDLVASAIPKRGSSPSEVSSWWKGLPPEEQQRLIQTHPEEIGNLDGIPVVVRDQANRSMLPKTREAMQTRLDQVGPEPPYGPVGNYSMGPLGTPESEEHRQWRIEETTARESIKGIDAIQARIDAGGKDGRPPVYLMGFEAEGNGRAIVAVNNPDTADNVVTYVPGTGARLGGIEGDVKRSDLMVDSAMEASPKETTSSITWVGYSAPQTIFPEAAMDVFARNAEGQLHSFETGLRATHEGEPARQTIIGHSYGSTTVGYAMRDRSLPVDGVMFVGSPGTGVDHAKDLGIAPERVWAARGDDDSISWARSSDPGDLAGDAFSSDNHLMYGRDPVNGGFGGNVIPTDPGTGHSDYWKEHSTSLRVMGHVITGELG